MEGQPAKRRRVYSLEPNKVVQAAFSRNYMNYLVPSLIKIKEKRSTFKEINICDFHNVIKNEVDMAMVFSAQGFAWSNALKMKLKRGGGVVNENGATSYEGTSRVIYDQKQIFFSKPQESKNNGMLQEKNNLLDGEDDDINGQLRSLRRLIPGGEEMCNEQMVTELESYISCLQMQVNILQYLTETS